MKSRVFCVALAVGLISVAVARGRAQEEFPYQIFDRYLEPLVEQIGMPGLTAVIIQGGKIAWSNNYGFADVENKIRPTIDTPYPVGGITQAVTGTLVGVCIDRFGLDINHDIREFAPTFPLADTTVRYVLSHASGGRFKYDPTLYAALTHVVESNQSVPNRCLSQTYRQAIATEVLDRIGMTRSVPGLDLARAEGAAAREQFDEATWNRYQAVLRDVAVPYRIDAKGHATRSEYPNYGLDASTGLVSTAYDLAQFEIALDNSHVVPVPLSSSTLDQMWSNTIVGITNNGLEQKLMMPTGLGWFVTKESGQTLVWSFGYIPDAGSALIVKLISPSTTLTPSKRLTLILLANSGGLAKGYDLENANVTSSPFVKVFLRLFI
jgi:CubicO group peptidase (beta-lactamase class C family)